MCSSITQGITNKYIVCIAKWSGTINDINYIKFKDFHSILFKNKSPLRKIRKKEEKNWIDFQILFNWIICYWSLFAVQLKFLIFNLINYKLMTFVSVSQLVLQFTTQLGLSLFITMPPFVPIYVFFFPVSDLLTHLHIFFYKLTKALAC